MKKVGIVTIWDRNNYGNRLQNYAVQETLKKLGYEVYSLKNSSELNKHFSYLFVYCVKKIQNKFKKKDELTKLQSQRLACFEEFNNRIEFYKGILMPLSANRINKKFDYFIVGSDQVWNPTIARLSGIDLLDFAKPNKKKISYSASFGVSFLNDKDKKRIRNKLNEFLYISVREDQGKELIEEITGRTDVEVLIDPTMLLEDIEWEKVMKKPKFEIKKEYILCYFLGGVSTKNKEMIETYARNKNMDTIYIFDKEAESYASGPSEFLYLEKNASLICTDSFHSSVFSLLFNVPFIIFEHEKSNTKETKMNSRIDTLLNKFHLQGRRFNGNGISEENMKHDYSEAYKILNEERKKSVQFLIEAMK